MWGQELCFVLFTRVVTSETAVVRRVISSHLIVKCAGRCVGEGVRDGTGVLSVQIYCWRYAGQVVVRGRSFACFSSFNVW